MDNQKFISYCKTAVVNITNLHVLKNGENKIGINDVYVVWLAKALQNNKALLSTTLDDGLYYEITFNGDKTELYVDTYKKQSNEALII